MFRFKWEIIYYLQQLCLVKCVVNLRTTTRTRSIKWYNSVRWSMELSSNWKIVRVARIKVSSQYYCVHTIHNCFRNFDAKIQIVVRPLNRPFIIFEFKNLKIALYNRLAYIQRRTLGALGFYGKPFLWCPRPELYWPTYKSKTPYIKAKIGKSLIFKKLHRIYLLSIEPYENISLLPKYKYILWYLQDIQNVGSTDVHALV